MIEGRARRRRTRPQNLPPCRRSWLRDFDANGRAPQCRAGRFTWAAWLLPPQP